jgi:hypothetical protein
MRAGRESDGRHAKSFCYGILGVGDEYQGQKAKKQGGKGGGEPTSGAMTQGESRKRSST